MWCSDVLLQCHVPQNVFPFDMYSLLEFLAGESFKTPQKRLIESVREVKIRVHLLRFTLHGFGNTAKHFYAFLSATWFEANRSYHNEGIRAWF
jgi:hypothetical protein